MPTWQPDWTDVTFDQAAASAAADECDAMAMRLRDAAAERHDLSIAARDGWRGRHREDFDQTVGHLSAQSDRLEQQLRRLAVAIRAAAAQARVEQAGREAQRHRWHQERAAEQEPRS